MVIASRTRGKEEKKAKSANPALLGIEPKGPTPV